MNLPALTQPVICVAESAGMVVRGGTPGQYRRKSPQKADGALGDARVATVTTPAILAASMYGNPFVPAAGAGMPPTGAYGLAPNLPTMGGMIPFPMMPFMGQQPPGGAGNPGTGRQ